MLIRFLVPAAAAEELAAELAKPARGRGALEQSSIASLYLDTADRRLASAGLVWRQRREGRRWIQRLSQTAGPTAGNYAGGTPDAAIEHEVLAPSSQPQALLHAGTAPGERLLGLLRRAEADGVAVAERFRCEVRRTTRTLRNRGTVIELGFDEGRLSAPGLRRPVRELGMRLLAGPPAALDALAQRWGQRFGLLVEPRDLAERGARLSLGQPHPALRKSLAPAFAASADASAALAAVIDECVAQIAHNAIALLDGDPALRAEHVHQLRVGIRRLRSGLRCFEGWAAQPGEDALAGLKALFTALGACRDADVLDSGVIADLARAGAPPVAWPGAATVNDPAALLRSEAVQRTLRQWLAWRWLLPSALQAGPHAEAGAEGAEGAEGGEPACDAAAAEGEASVNVCANVTGTAADDAEADNEAGATAPPAALRQRAERRLARWHQRIVAEARAFDELDEPSVHALRKRVKRQRYAVEFFTVLLRRRGSGHYLAHLAALQDGMGELNDLFVARDRYQARLPDEPTAWFALGWLAARIVQARAGVQGHLLRLACVPPPRARR
jgi:CHAD domain-containing protein